MADIHVIAVPFHAGAYNLRVGAGPTRLLDDGLVDQLRQAGHDTRAEFVAPVEEFEGEIGRTFEVKRRVAEAVRAARAAGAFPLVLAGNCNVEVGVSAGLQAPAAALIWFDAHPDFDTPDEHRSGYLDGMGVATLAGQCWHNLAATIPGFTPLDLDRLLYCGIRDFEPGQLEKVERAGIAAVVGKPEGGVVYVEDFRERIEALACREAMIHLDVDCLDTSVGIANEYAAPGGLSEEDLLACLRTTCRSARPLSLTIASFNPSLRGADRISAAARSAALLVASFA
ncbi:MAG TPA: arginase family protein [Allosphingosinicella sp.]